MNLNDFAARGLAAQRAADAEISKANKRTEDQAALVRNFNARVPVGAVVMVRLDDGTVKNTVTRSPAWLMGGHSAVILLEGISGGYSLSRVTAP